MPSGLFNIALLLPAWVLVMARVAALVLAVPVFSSTMIPRTFRAMLVLAITAMCMPGVMMKLPPDLSLGRAVAGLPGEILIGVLLGLAASVVFLAAQMAMQFISQQAGLSLGEVFNPLLENESAVLEQVGFFVGLAVFMGAGGAHAIVRVLLGSFDEVPPLMFLRGDARELAVALPDFCASMMDLTFRLAIRLSGPAMLALLLSTLAMGFLVKTMPQFNVLTVGFPVKAVLGIGLLALMITRWDGVMGDAIGEATASIESLIHTAGRGLRHAG